MVPLNSLDQDNQNEVQYEFFHHVLPLALVSHDAKHIIHGDIPFLRLRWHKWSVMWLFNHVMPQHPQWHHWISYVKTIKMRCNMTFLVLWHHWEQPQHHVMLMVLSMAPVHFLSQEIKMRYNMIFLLIWCHWHWHQCHIMPSTSSMPSLHFIG